jgi:acyl-CoA dehydrogenase
MPIDFAITKEQEELKAVAREFIEKHVMPRWKEIVEKDAIPLEIVREMARLGLFGVSIPDKYGGLGLDPITVGLVLEELAYRDPTAAITLLYIIHAECTAKVAKYGSEELKQELLPKAARGDVWFGLGITEPGAGSDVIGISSTARKTGNEYVLDGEKRYVIGVREGKERGVWFAEGSRHLTLTYTDKNKGHRGMTLFALPLPDPRIPIRLEKPLMRGISWGGFTMNSITIPELYGVGAEGQGFFIVMETLDYGRALIAIALTSAAKGVIKYAIEYMKQRKAFGKPIVTFQGVQFQIANHWARLEAAEALAYKALWVHKLSWEGKNVDRALITRLSAEAKLEATEAALAAAYDAIRWMGAYGYTIENPASIMWTNYKGYDIAEGTSDIMRLIIYREVIGKEWTQL